MRAQKQGYPIVEEDQVFQQKTHLAKQFKMLNKLKGRRTYKKLKENQAVKEYQTSV